MDLGLTTQSGATMLASATFLPELATIALGDSKTPTVFSAETFDTFYEHLLVINDDLLRFANQHGDQLPTVGDYRQFAIRDGEFSPPNQNSETRHFFQVRNSVRGSNDLQPIRYLRQTGGGLFHLSLSTLSRSPRFFRLFATHLEADRSMSLRLSGVKKINGNEAKVTVSNSFEIEAKSLLVASIINFLGLSSHNQQRVSSLINGLELLLHLQFGAIPRFVTIQQQQPRPIRDVMERLGDQFDLIQFDWRNFRFKNAGDDLLIESAHEGEQLNLELVITNTKPRKIDANVSLSRNRKHRTEDADKLVAPSGDLLKWISNLITNTAG